MRVGGPSNVGRAVQTVPSKDKRNVGSCWLESLTGFKLCATTPNMNNTEQHATACANGRNS